MDDNEIMLSALILHGWTVRDLGYAEDTGQRGWLWSGDMGSRPRYEFLVLESARGMLPSLPKRVREHMGFGPQAFLTGQAYADDLSAEHQRGEHTGTINKDCSFCTDKD